MVEPTVAEGFEVGVDEARARRFLTKAATTLRPHIERAFAGALAEARDLIAPRGIYEVGSGSELSGTGRFARLDRVAFCVCTIGPELERRAAELSHRGELLRAVLLDAVGSAAAEAVAGHMEGLIAAEAAREGLRVSRRVSPGCGDWDVGGQRALFRLLPAGRIGVELSEGCMMAPLKSSSFVVRLAREPAAARGEDRCGKCDGERCRLTGGGKGKASWNHTSLRG
jgi:cobalamin-dependent methionine synthase I